MCGRYTLHTPIEALMRLFNFENTVALSPRYNIPPSLPVLCVRNDPEMETGGRQGALLKWGLVPSWAKEASIGNRMINARSETAHEKPSFKSSLKKRRCLIPADGFYEWRKATTGKGKEPVYIFPKDGRPLAFAGIWSRWERGEAPLETCAILTMEAEGPIAEVHHRMPVILPEKAQALWMDADLEDPAMLQSVFSTDPAKDLSFHVVSKRVNKAGTEGPELIEREAEAQSLF
jgi:putative SOS response-associated peptidase YedK